MQSQVLIFLQPAYMQLEPSSTEVFYGADNTIKAIQRFQSNAKETWCACVDKTIPALSAGKKLRKGYVDGKARGVKIKYLTEITKDNLEHCKKVMEVAELRHFAGITGSFAVTESECISIYKKDIDSDPADVLVHSNLREMVGQQQNIFDALWNNAIPAEQRMREIEEGIPLERTEVVSDPHTIKSLYQGFVSEAREEILLILPTVNAFARQKRLGTLDLLKKQRSEKGVKVRILVPVIEDKTHVQDILDLETRGIQVNRLSRNPPQAERRRSTKVTVAIIDNKTSLVIELKNDEKETFVDATGTAIMSTGKAMASSYARFFESLWRETRLNAQLREADKMQQEFINIAAHELRTPVQPILGVIDMYDISAKAAEENDDGEVRVKKTHMRRVARNATRLIRLSSDILDATKIESNTLKLNIDSKVDLIKLVTEAIEDSKRQIADGKITFVTDFAKERLQVDVDSDRITQVLTNLLGNAIKFTTDKGGSISVTVKKSISSSGDDDRKAQIIISDDGKGIDSEIMPRLFQKFASKTDSGRGTGLGLFISKAIIEAHQGKILGRNNSDGKGATFSFTLPLV